MTRPDIPVTISGDVRNFEGALARVRAASKSTVTDVAASFARVRGAIAGPAALIASLGIQSVVAAVRDTARAIADVGDQARIAGVSAKAFQELKFAAEQVRIPVDALQDGLKELSLRTDEFIASSGKSGSAAESFRRLGYSVDELRQKIKSPSDLLVELVGRVEKLDKAAQTRIFDELFGGQGGEQFVKFLSDGEQALRDNIKAANDLGIVMDDQMIKKAAEIDRRFNVIATTVSVNLKAAVIAAAEAMDGFMTKYNQWRAGVDAANAGAAIGAMVNRKGPQGPNQPAENTTTPKTDRLSSATDILRQALTQQRIESAFANSSGSHAGSRAASAKAAKEEKSAVDEVIASLKEEISLVGASDAERAKANELRRAGVEATSEQGKQISSLVDQLYKQQEAEEQLQRKREEAQEAAVRFGQTLDDQLLRVIDGTFDAKDALAALVQELINAETSGKGLFGSLFSALAGGFGGSSAKSLNSSIGFTGANTTLGSFLGYGGARAGGGDVTPGRIYRVNEYEDEYFAPTQHGRIIAPSKLRDATNTSDGGRSVVEIRLGEGLVGDILQESGNQSVQLIRANNDAQANYRQNGGSL